MDGMLKYMVPVWPKVEMISKPKRAVLWLRLQLDVDHQSQLTGSGRDEKSAL